MTVTPMAGAAGFQYVPVPNEHVAAVLAFLGTRLTAAADLPAAPEHADDAATDGWSDAELRRFTSWGTKTSRIVTALLDLLSERPGIDGALGTQELVEKLEKIEGLEVDYNVMKNQPTQVSRTLHTHFTELEAPYLSYWGGSEMLYYVTPERAEQWQRIRG